VREKVYKEKRSGRGRGKAAYPASKNKHTAPSHTLSYKHFSRTSSHCPPRSENAKQCGQTPTSPTASQGTEARPQTPAAAAAPVASSPAAPTHTTGVSNGSGLHGFGPGWTRNRDPGPGQEPPRNRTAQVLAGCYPDRTYTRGFLAGLEPDRGSNCTVPTTLATIKYLSSDRIMT
jgi:hypothetical protein